jgi:hypothetical protein
MNKREYLALPLDLVYINRARYDKMEKDLQTKIVSYRKYPNGLFRVMFVTTEHEKGEVEERQHLLWIQIIQIDGRKYVKYRCDCKYFEYRQLRSAKRMFDIQEIDNDLVVVVDIHSREFQEYEKLFNIDKHAFLALKEMFDFNVEISI